MRVDGLDGHGDRVLSAELAHGQDPAALTWAAGWRLVEPLTADREGDALVLTVRVDPATGTPPPEVLAAPSVPRDRDLVLDPGEQPVPRQRVAAYALVFSDRGLLGTEFSDRTAGPGTWGPPGGGLDPGERPIDALHREVHEETGQRIAVQGLVGVHSRHWIGRSPDGVAEDFHAVRIFYRARCDDPTEPVVHDVGGTTASAAWIPLDAVAAVPWASGWRTLLDPLL